MATSTTVIIPTRERPAYLDVALAGIVAQARAAGAGVLVVGDGASAATRAVAGRHGVQYVAHEQSRGLNAARNTGAATTDADLLVYVDDDVDVRAGWLAALIGAAEALPDEVGVLTGPIHARFEDHRLPSCGREGPPITFLDLGPADVDAPHAWGANMTVRRSALEAVGPFDERRELYGDEQEWQARWLAAGGRIRYIAAAALDHRRAGDDSRLRSLCRAAYARGGASRRFDVFKGTAPSQAAEATLVLRCATHVLRYRCINGIVLTAHALGRLQTARCQARALRPKTAAASQTASDFPANCAQRRCLAPLLRSETAAVSQTGGEIPANWAQRTCLAPWRRWREGRQPLSDAEDFLSGTSGEVAGRRGKVRLVVDRSLDVLDVVTRRRARLRAVAAASPPRLRVLVTGVHQTDREHTVEHLREELSRSRHDVTIALEPAGPHGKFGNVNELLAQHDLERFDWVIVTDDDVVVPRGFLDGFLYLAERHGLKLAEPAQSLASHAAWHIVRRRPRSAVRETTFVEIGPVTAFHRDTFSELLPFPDLRQAWGLDLHWAHIARTHGWRIGIVDALPIRHEMRGIARTYPREAALAEARTFLAGHPYLRRDEVRTVRAHR